MKRIGIVACLAIMTGCSGFAASDKAADPAGPGAGAAEPQRGQDPAAPPLSGTPVSDELTEEFGIFVATRGGDDGDGTRAHPVASIGKGIALAKAAGKRVYVCAGVYREALTLVDGIPIVGGLTCDAHEWTTSDARSRVEAETSPAAIANGITKPTRIDHLEIVAPDATVGSGSSIGMLAVDAGGLTIASSRIVAGNAMKGDDGVEGVQLTQAGHVDGAPGVAEGRYMPAQDFPGGPGGTSVCAGAPGHDGESGGAGGKSGLYNTYTTSAGFPLWQAYANVASNGAGSGETRTGAPGEGGESGGSAGTWGSFGETGFTPADGQPGHDGAPGKGGRGGDGVAMVKTLAANAGSYIWTGNAGAGGGAGGCPGLAGTPGKGGGASVGILAVRSAFAMDKSEVVAGAGGAGGKGAFGSAPTPGGNPGTPGVTGTAGGAGGVGGAAGASGSGAGGPSIAIAQTEGDVRLTDTTTTVGKPGDGAPKLTSSNTAIAASATGIAQAVLTFVNGG